MPKTNLSLAAYHLFISPALPTARSINVSPGFDILAISIFLTYRLWKSLNPRVKLSPILTL